MGELLASLGAILLLDVMNPVLFALLFLAAGSSRPLGNSTAMLIGHTLAYFSAGFAVAYGLDTLSARFQNPNATDYGIGLVLGIICLLSVIPLKKKGNQDVDTPNFELTPLTRLIGPYRLNCQ